jgi:hypothetical protein
LTRLPAAVKATESSGLFLVASGRFFVFMVMHAGSAAGTRAGAGNPALDTSESVNKINMG